MLQSALSCPGQAWRQAPSVVLFWFKSPLVRRAAPTRRIRLASSLSHPGPKVPCFSLHLRLASAGCVIPCLFAWFSFCLLGHLSSPLLLLTPGNVAGGVSAPCRHHVRLPGGFALPSRSGKPVQPNPLIASCTSGLPNLPLNHHPPHQSAWSCVEGPWVLTLPFPH